MDINKILELHRETSAEDWHSHTRRLQLQGVVGDDYKILGLE